METYSIEQTPQHPRGGTTYAQAFSLRLAVEWQDGLMVKTRWLPPCCVEVDPFTQQLVQESMRDPRSVAPYIAPAGSAYSARMREALWRLPMGHLLTYAELARELGQRGARGVASALGANPLPWFVPCHRVIRTDGSLGGYGAGTRYKELLLRAEGAWGERVGGENGAGQHQNPACAK